MEFEKRLKPLITIVVTAAAIMVALMVVFKSPFEDPDLGWHLVNGFRIWNQGDFPLPDRYTWTVSGYPYADSWWLTEVMMVGLLPGFGFGGLAVLFTALGVGALVLLTGSFRSWRQTPGTMAGLLLTGALLAGPVIGSRGQTFSFLLFSLLWLGLRQLWVETDRGDQASPARFDLPRWTYALPVFFWFWANLHAGWVLGLTLLFLVIGLEWLCLVIVRWTSYRGWLVQGYQGRLSPEKLGKSKDRLVSFSLLGVVSAGLTLVNPFGLWLYRSISQDASSALIKNNIIEWLAPNFHQASGIFLVSFLLLVVMVLVGQGLARLHPVEAIAFLFVVFNALTAVRNSTYLLSVSLPYLSLALRKIRLPKLIFSFPSFQLLFWLMMLIAVFCQFLLPELKDYQSPVALMKKAKQPVQAALYLKAYPPGDRVFNHYGWGGFMIWQTPEFPTFIDGRMPGWKGQVLKETEERSVFEDYIQIVELKDGFEETINLWGIDWFWLTPDERIVPWLRLNPEWETVYQDETAVVLSKNGRDRIDAGLKSRFST